MLEKKNILGVGIADATKKEVLEYIVKNLENFKKKLFVVTPNPEFLVLANKNKTFKEMLNKADLASVDGVGVMIAAKILGKPLKERLTGVELMESLCERVAEKPITVGFLGGRDKVAEATAECLRKKCPGLKVVFAREEWDLGSIRPLNDSLKPGGNTSLAGEGKSHLPADEFYGHDSRGSVKRSFRGESHPVTIDILFVAFGAPKQEFWISEHLDKIPVKVAIGVGGAFDYISGRVPRAPLLMRSIGLEWLFRLIIQPWRICRQLSLLKFIYLVFKEKIKQQKLITLLMF